MKQDWDSITSKAETIAFHNAAVKHMVPVYGTLSVTTGGSRTWNISFDSRNGPMAHRIAHKIFAPLLEEGLRRYIEALKEEIER